MTEADSRLPSSVTLWRSPAFLYACGIGALSVVLLLGWPIVKLDTDLWFHLSNGKFLFEHHAIPSRAFFSFLASPREWIDYSWLFQAVVYGLYTWAGYGGLIVLRPAVYLATLWCAKATGTYSKPGGPMCAT